MAKAPNFYTRLTRNASGFGTHTSLWLGPDHLMIVTSSGYLENYARLQFRDVKAFFVTGSDRRLGWRVAWGLLATLFAIIVVVAIVNREPPIFSGIFLGFTLGGVVWNELLGPGCHTYVVTGVQTARLPSLVRMKKARRVLGRLQPLIEAAQAELVAAPIALLPVITPPPLAGGVPPVKVPPGPPPLA